MEWINNIQGAQCLRSINDVMSILSGEVRFEFVRALALGPHTVSELAEMLALQLPCASHNLGILRRAGFVTFRASKKERIYRLTEAIKVHRLTTTVVLKAASLDGDQITIQSHIPFPAESAQSTRVEFLQKQLTTA